MHALVTADTIGGVWTYTQELVTGLVRRGVRVTLVSFGEIPTGEQTQWMESLEELDFHPTAFRLEWMQDAESDIRASSEYLLELIEEVNPDVLHLSQYCYGSMQVRQPKIVVAHSDVVSWWHAVHGTEPPHSAWMKSYRAIVRRGLAGATTVVAPSQWMRDQIQSHYGFLRDVRVIYNGRNPGLFSPHTTKEDLVVSAGRLWDAGKQVSLLLLHDHKVPVAIAGAETTPDGAVPATVPRLKYNSVKFCGEIPHSRMVGLLARASIYAATSRYEPFGLAPLEAALSRCALVVNDIPPLREIWGDAVLYFAANDSVSLARAIDKLNYEAALRRFYGNRAYERARRLFTAERMVDSYMGLYVSLSRRPRGEKTTRPVAGAALG